MSKYSDLLTLLITFICLVAFGCGGGTRGTNGPKNRIIMGTVTNQESVQIENFSATVTVSTDEGVFTAVTDPETGFYQVEIETQDDELFSISVDSEIFSERSFMIQPTGEQDVISANFEYDGQNVNLISEQNSSNQTKVQESLGGGVSTSTSTSASPTPNSSTKPTPSIPTISPTEEPSFFITRFFGIIDSQYAPLDQSSISVAVTTGIYTMQTDNLGRYQLEIKRKALTEQITVSIASADVRKSFSIGTLGPVESYELYFSIDQNGEVSITDRSGNGSNAPSPSVSPSPTPKPDKAPSISIIPETTIEPDFAIKPEITTDIKL